MAIHLETADAVASGVLLNRVIPVSCEVVEDMAKIGKCDVGIRFAMRLSTHRDDMATPSMRNATSVNRCNGRNAPVQVIIPVMITKGESMVQI